MQGENMIICSDNATGITRNSLRLLKSAGKRVTCRGMGTHELTGVTYTVYNPRKRITALAERTFNVFFNYAEDLWILQGRGDAAMMLHYNKQLATYLDEGADGFHAPYGYRLRNAGLPMESIGDNYRHSVYEPGWGVQTRDQLLQCHAKLSADPTTRQAVMTIWNPVLDNEPSKDIPCNNWSQFLLRDGYLDMHQVVRSNDVLWGTSTNIMQFTTLQEVMAGWLGVEVGKFVCFVGSLHYYTSMQRQVDDILRADRKWMGDYQNAKDEYEHEGIGRHKLQPFFDVAGEDDRPDVYRIWKPLDARLDIQRFSRLMRQLTALETALRTTTITPDASYEEDISVLGSMYGPYWEDYGRIFYIYALLKAGKGEDALLQAHKLHGACRYSVADYMQRFIVPKIVNKDTVVQYNEGLRQLVGDRLHEYMRIGQLKTVEDVQ